MASKAAFTTPIRAPPRWSKACVHIHVPRPAVGHQVRQDEVSYVCKSRTAAHSTNLETCLGVAHSPGVYVIDHRQACHGRSDLLKRLRTYVTKNIRTAQLEQTMVLVMKMIVMVMALAMVVAMTM